MMKQWMNMFFGVAPVSAAFATAEATSIAMAILNGDWNIAAMNGVPTMGLKSVALRSRETIRPA
jgi:hypothetical protein